MCFVQIISLLSEVSPGFLVGSEVPKCRAAIQSWSVCIWGARLGGCGEEKNLLFQFVPLWFCVVKPFGQFPFGFVVAQSSLWLMGGVCGPWDGVCGSWEGSMSHGTGLWLVLGRSPVLHILPVLCSAAPGRGASSGPGTSQLQSLFPELPFPSCFAV